MEYLCRFYVGLTIIFYWVINHEDVFALGFFNIEAGFRVRPFLQGRLQRPFENAGR